MAYSGDWTATSQVAQRAVESGLIDRFGTLNPTDGGSAQRYSLSGRWHETTAATGIDDIHFHPLEPRSFRLSLTKQW